MSRILIKTKDDSFTIYQQNIDEIYHSKNGAIQESMHIFINNGLYNIKNKNEIKILEFGFGTGLNLFLTYINNFTKLYYLSLEKYPIENALIKSLNYKDILGYSDIFDLIHLSNWNENIKIDENFIFQKKLIDFINFKSDTKFDLVYFDAFSPDKQPELWTEEIFSKVFSLMNNNSILITYCAKSIVRKNLINSGFQVEKLPGPPGKREIIKAIKK